MIILIGASASGKTEVARILMDTYHYKKCITTTTRTIRPGETEGLSYHFVSKEQFDHLKNANAFIETTIYQDEYYGLQTKDILLGGIVILDPPGANELVRIKNEAFVVYMETSEQLRKERMLNRGDALEKVEKRIASDAKLFDKNKICKIDLILENEQQTLKDIASIIDQAYQKSQLLDESQVFNK